MKGLLRRSATAGVMLLMMLSIGLWQSATAEAAAKKITWTTTDVILDKGKCTVRGYFKNDRNTEVTVSKVKLVVHVWDAVSNATIYDIAWNVNVNSGKGLHLAAGAQANWSFSYSDENCPAYKGGNRRWIVTPTIWTQ